MSAGLLSQDKRLALYALVRGLADLRIRPRSPSKQLASTGGGRCRSGTSQEQATQLLATLILTIQLAHTFATGAVAALTDLLAHNK